MSMPFKFGGLLGDICSFFQHLQTVLVEALLRDRCNVLRAPCWHVICCSIWQQSVAPFNEVWEQKLINNFNYCLQQH